MTRQRVRLTVLLGSFALFQSFRLVHLLFSPVLLLLAAGHGVVGGSMILYGALFASSLLLGRAFCGWACPGCGLQELVALKVRRPVRSRLAGRVKWAIAAALFGATSVLAARAGGLRSVDPLFGTRSTSTAQGVLLLSGHIVVIAGFALALGRWASCRAVCWIAPLLVVGTRVARAGGWPAPPPGGGARPVLRLRGVRGRLPDEPARRPDGREGCAGPRRVPALRHLRRRMSFEGHPLRVHPTPRRRGRRRLTRERVLGVRGLEDVGKAVGLFNRGEGTVEVGATWADVGVSGKQTVRDLWRQKDVGVFEGRYAAPVGRHGVVMVKLADARRPSDSS